MVILQAVACGAAAQQILAAGEPGSVIGLTSRGIFCATASGSVVFISYEAWRGPLTINLIPAAMPGDDCDRPQDVFQKGMPPFERVVQHSPVDLSDGQVRFVEADILVQTANLAGWQPAWISSTAGVTPEIRDRYRQVAGIVAQASQGKGWNRLLEGQIDVQVWGSSQADLAIVCAHLDRFAASFQSRDLEEAETHVGWLLGRGSGLTPSGDDVITGFLLARSRIYRAESQRAQDEKAGHRVDLNSHSFENSLSLRIVDLARQRTTWLAAGLIECAAAGQADERLVTALDGILSASLPPEECARRLLAYGSSSGGDALLGIGLAITL